MQVFRLFGIGFDLRRGGQDCCSSPSGRCDRMSVRSLALLLTRSTHAHVFHRFEFNHLKDQGRLDGMSLPVVSGERRP